MISKSSKQTIVAVSIVSIVFTVNGYGHLFAQEPQAMSEEIRLLREFQSAFESLYIERMKSIHVEPSVPEFEETVRKIRRDTDETPTVDVQLVNLTSDGDERVMYTRFSLKVGERQAYQDEPVALFLVQTPSGMRFSGTSFPVLQPTMPRWRSSEC